MSDIERLHEAVEHLPANRGPCYQALVLGDGECILLRLAQWLHGVSSETPTDQFHDTLLRELGLRAARYIPITRRVAHALDSTQDRFYSKCMLI